MHGEGITGDELGIGLIRFGTAQFAFGKGLDFGGINDTDRIALTDHEVRQRDAISPSRLHTNQWLIVDKKGKQPTKKVSKALFIVSERFMFVLAIAKAGNIKLYLGNIDTDDN